MAMDVFERLNRKFGVWYEGLFGGAEGRDLRPRDILRRILAAMEDGRREGLDGQVYVPNAYTLQIAVESDDERSYLRTFLHADELAAAVARSAEQHNYQIRGPLVFTVEEMDAPKSALAAGTDRVRITCRFDTTSAPTAAPSSPAAAPPAPAVETVLPPEWEVEDDASEPGTIAAVPTATLASLVVRSTDGTLQDVYPLTARGARVGRGRQVGNDILLTGDGMISKSHVMILMEAGRFVVRDESSTNGTTLNGERLAPGQTYPLQTGDEIKLGQTAMVFRAATQTTAPPPMATSPSPMPAPSVAAANFRGDTAPFRLIAGDGETYPLASTMSVGRALTSDIVVIGNGVASQHARLTLRGETVYVEDMRTAGGTRVNGEPIPAAFPVALYEGDQIAFGETLFRLARSRTA